MLKAGGQASILDLRKDASLQDIEMEVRNMHLSAWNALLTRVIFRHGLLRAAYTREQLERMAGDSRFGRCEIASRGIGLELRLTSDSQESRQMESSEGKEIRALTPAGHADRCAFM